MSAQHTAGPWQVAGPCEVTGRYSVIHNGPLFYVSDASQTGDGEANARLAAAAPDLLKALRALASTARTFRNVPKEEQEWTSIDDDALKAAFAAIAKATGGAA